MIATKTIEAIDAALEAAQDREHRNHLGASIIGGPCLREVWYKWHWCKKESFIGRMLRLFDRGHKEEPRFVEWLRAIGCEVWTVDPATGKQFRISDHGGHFGGSCDGVGRGIPDLPPGVPFLCEFKTHNAKSFKKLVEQGLCSSKPAHFAQCQVYMSKLNLRFALYLAVNKDTDALHGEIVQLHPDDAKRHLDRAGVVIASPVPTPRISQKPSYWECGFCLFKGICHFGEPVEKNCRTCKYAKPGPGASWVCTRYNVALDQKMQRKGCRDWTLGPGLGKPPEELFNV